MTRHDILKGCNTFLKAIADVPALSCVEYYFIPWLREFTAVEALYPETIVSYAQAEEIIQRSSYASPQGIARVQEIAERYGIVTHEKCRYNGEFPKGNELWLLRSLNGRRAENSDGGKENECVGRYRAAQVGKIVCQSSDCTQ